MTVRVALAGPEDWAAAEEASSGSPAQELKAYLERFGKPVTACDTVAEGVALAKKLAGSDGVVLAYGSLYMVGDIEAAARG